MTQSDTPGPAVILLSGGLDSTHALIVAAKACDRLGLPRSTILGFTMPGFATGEDTRSNAWALMKALGITAQEIDIRAAAHAVACCACTGGRSWPRGTCGTHSFVCGSR